MLDLKKIPRIKRASSARPRAGHWRTFDENEVHYWQYMKFKLKVLNPDRHITPLIPPVPVTTQDKLWDAISKVDGRDADCSYVMTGMLNHDFTTYLGLGTAIDSHIAWSLESDQEFLTVTQPSPKECRDIDDTLCESFLGVSLHVQLPVGDRMTAVLKETMEMRR
jgi:hypothetical protein